MEYSCIYAILNKINNKKYVGSAVNLYRRKNIHLHHLRKNIHHSKYLQRAWNKYGEQNFEFIILELCNKDNLIEKEQFYIDKYNPEYNTCKIAGSSLGLKRTKKQIKNISMAHIGQIPWNKGVPATEEQKNKQSLAMKGRISGAKGKKWSKQSKDKLSKTLTGRKLPQYVKDKLSKKVIRIDLDSGEEIQYNSMTDAANRNGVKVANISRVCLGKAKTTGGFKWRFSDL